MKTFHILCVSLCALRVLRGKMGLLTAGKTLFTYIILSFTYCTEEAKHSEAIIVKENLLDSIPSGSGLALHKDSLFIIGDDAVFLYQVSLKNNRYKTLSVTRAPGNDFRVNKDDKHDYEAAAMLTLDGAGYLFLFGSGSKSPQRDSLLIVDADKMALDTLVSIKRFYDHLKKVTGTGDKDWNLEGATVVKEKMVLFNRGNNMVIMFNVEEFLDYLLTTGRTPPAVEYFKVVLPAIEGYEARLSGAATIDDKVLFSASVEKTDDWMLDGPILGSYTGVIDLNKQKVRLTALVGYGKDKPSKEKLESVVLLSKAANDDLILLAVADNDDGRSRLMEIRLKKPSD